MSENEKLDLLLSEMQDMKGEMQDMKGRITNTALHLENATDKNIQLVAESFTKLANNLNHAITAADKNIAYEIKVNYLVREVDKLKEDVAELKSKIA